MAEKTLDTPSNPWTQILILPYKHMVSRPWPSQTLYDDTSAYVREKKDVKISKWWNMLRATLLSQIYLHCRACHTYKTFVWWHCPPVSWKAWCSNIKLFYTHIHVSGWEEPRACAWVYYLISLCKNRLEPKTKVTLLCTCCNDTISM